MTSIEKMIKNRLDEITFEEEERKSELVGVSLRLPKDSLILLDLIAEKLRLSRSDVARTFLQTSISEAMKTLELPVDEVVNYIEYREEKEGQDFIESGGNLSE